MPQVIVDPDAPPKEQAHLPTTYPDLYRGVTVDTRYIPSSALLTHVEGSSMSVNWYGQVIDRDVELAGQNPTRNPILQPYFLIEGMELKVTSPFVFEQDNATKQFPGKGTANIYPFVKPNKGDMFLTSLPDGREGIFEVDDSRQMSILKDTCFQIDYVFIGFSDTNRFRIADLNTKVIETYSYVKDFLTYGQNPVLLKEDADIVRNLQYSYNDIMRQYFQEFLSKEFSTLLIPGQAFSTYDHFLTKFMLKFSTTLDAVEIQYTRLLNVDGPDDMKTPTVWDLCAQRNLHLKRMLNKEMGITSTQYFPSDPMMEGVHHAGIHYIVYPKFPRQSWDDVRNMRTPIVLAYRLRPVPSIAGTLEDLIEEANLASLPYAGAPLIKDVLCDDYYIFSEAFYMEDRTKMSKLEMAVWDMLERKALNLKLLDFFCKTYQTWGGLERYYYTPFILMLIRAQIRAV
ncbi:MAG: hypothetical protein P4L77_10810 [Sulfuriferula sp.]|nr:hypothetical protein [Sulfuriferula sp.]